jgi:signal transduction histidine kinase
MRVLREPFTLRSWKEFLYALISLPVGALGFVFSVGSLVSSALLLITFLGLPMMALAMACGRAIGAAQRRLAASLLGLQIKAPDKLAWRDLNVIGRVNMALRDTAGWRAHGYLLLKVPVAAFAVAIAFRVGGVIFLISPLLQDPDDARQVQRDANGFIRHSIVQYGDFRFDTWPKLLLLALQGLVMILLAPWALRLVLSADKYLMRWLLGPSALAKRVQDLEHQRAAAVDDSSTRLRQIERDLHDGAQAQLVAVAMKLSLAREKLAGGLAGLDVVRVRELVDTAHDTARMAISDLRNLVNGIHPPILNDGLAAALTTLAARSVIPAELRVDLPSRPSPAIETITYFCAAELLTNVAKHSGATHATIELYSPSGRLRLSVLDDGTGGASLTNGSGLNGLFTRARTVDGHLSLDSPPGGPTRVTVELPMHT